MINLKFNRSTKFIPELNSERIDSTQVLTNDTSKILSRTFYVHEFDDNTVQIQVLQGIPDIDSPNKSDCKDKSFRYLSIKDSTNKNCLSFKLKSELENNSLDESFFTPDCKPCLDILQVNNNDSINTNIDTCQKTVEFNSNDCQELYIGIDSQHKEDKIDPYYFKVRQRYILSEYTGYLAYGPELDYPEGFDFTQVKYNPNEINEYKGWLKTVSSFYSYSYVLPKKNGNKIKLDFLLKTATNLFTDDNIYSYVRSIVNRNNPTIDEAKKYISLPEPSYILDKSEATIIGVSIHSINKSSNRIVFKTLSRTGLMLSGSVLNCNLWWSTDGITKEEALYTQTEGFNYNSDAKPTVITSMVKAPYLILETFISFDINSNGNILFNPLFAINPVVTYRNKTIPSKNLVNINNSNSNQVRFTCEINFIGCHYLVYKEEFIAIESHGVHRYPEGQEPILEDPKPYNVEVTYDFNEEESQWLNRDSFQ